MTVKKLDKTEWRTFFDMLSRTLKDARAEVDVVGASLGAQVEADWRPLFGVAYDDKDDVVEVALEGVDDLISAPSDVFVDEDSGTISSMEIIGGDKLSRIIKFKEPAPAPTATRR